MADQDVAGYKAEVDAKDAAAANKRQDMYEKYATPGSKAQFRKEFGSDANFRGGFTRADDDPDLPSNQPRVSPLIQVYPLPNSVNSTKGPDSVHPAPPMMRYENGGKVVPGNTSAKYR